MNKNFDEGIILKANFERSVTGEFQVVLVTKIYNTWGWANMYFKGEQINKLFNEYAKVMHGTTNRTVSLDKFVYKEIYTPKVIYNNQVPRGLTFTNPLDSANFKGFVENSNGELNK